MLQQIGVVAIGRNEGERLKACLESSNGQVGHVIYVDSGSSDGSPELAQSLGADVVLLDSSRPFTAARAERRVFPPTSDCAINSICSIYRR